jgi:hypothetical protein
MSGAGDCSSLVVYDKRRRRIIYNVQLFLYLFFSVFHSGSIVRKSRERIKKYIIFYIFTNILAKSGSLTGMNHCEKICEQKNTAFEKFHICS